MHVSHEDSTSTDVPRFFFASSWTTPLLSVLAPKFLALSVRCFPSDFFCCSHRADDGDVNVLMFYALMSCFGRVNDDRRGCRLCPGL